MRKTTPFIGLFLGCWLAMLVPAVLGQEAGTPSLISYQRKLIQANSSPHTDGNHEVTFKLFDAPTGGTLIWGATYTVPVVNGLFSVTLGAPGGTQLPNIPVTDLRFAFGGLARYLELTVAGAPLLPPQQLASVPYALVAQEASRAAAAALAESLIPQLAQALNPPGTIITYAGAVTDNGSLSEPVPGYLLCNGAVIDATASSGKYAALKTALNEAWGNGANANANTVNLPDLRGVFLRGWNGGASDDFRDLNVSDTQRIARKTGGNTGDKVGSFQMNQLQNHNHWAYSNAFGTGAFSDFVSYGRTQDNHVARTISVGGVREGRAGAETRPKNANVVYLIKY